MSTVVRGSGGSSKAGGSSGLNSPRRGGGAGGGGGGGGVGVVSSPRRPQSALSIKDPTKVLRENSERANRFLNSVQQVLLRSLSTLKIWILILVRI
jgi:hypothetical protein